jgi:MoaA/NifB/PqqE/SkfB family radical SAM enzyme
VEDRMGNTLIDKLGRHILSRKLKNAARWLRGGIKSYSKYTRDYVSDGPEAATIIIDSRCNLRCRMCIYHSKEILRPQTKFWINFNQFKAVVDVLYDNGLKSCHICAIGEPFLNKDIFRMIEYSKRKGLYTSVLSNGENKILSKNLESVVESGLDMFITDLDSGDKDQAEFIKRGIKYDELISNLRTLLDLRAKGKSDMKVQLNSIVMKYNYMNLERLFDTAHSLGIDSVMLSYLVPVSEKYDFMSIRNAINLSDKKILSVIYKSVNYGRKLGLDIRVPELYKPGVDANGTLMCWALWNKMFVNFPAINVPRENWLGNAAMFCKLSCTKYGDSFGNILKQSFGDVWNGEKMIELRRRLRTGKNVPRICIEECPNYHNPNAIVDPHSRELEEEWLYRS